MLQPGYFLVTDCYKDLDLVTSSYKTAARVTLHRLVQEGVIEPHGNGRGCYRLVDRGAEELKWWKADTSKTMSIHLPLDLHNLVKFFPKTVIIVASLPNAGKTAFLLNVALLNKDAFPVTYFSTEMSLEELKDRLDKFVELRMINNINEWRKISFKSRFNNFHNVIDPNGLNIIDYLDITSDAYTIHDRINEIFQKLDRGLAVIAIQKNLAQNSEPREFILCFNRYFIYLSKIIK